MPEQIIPHLAVQAHSSAEPRELGSEDPGRSAELQAVVVDELLCLAPDGYDISLHQDVDAQIGDHGNVELHFSKWGNGFLREG